MRRKYGVLIVVMLLMSLSLSFVAQSGSEQEPEVIDKKFDVKLFGTIPFLPQFWFKNVDFQSVWFYEEQTEPQSLYIVMKVRDLKMSSQIYDYIYVVDWIYDNVSYGASVHLLPEGFTPFIVGTLDEDGNDYIDYSVCQGSFDENQDTITWKIQKQDIGGPSVGEMFSDIFPSTHLRFPLSSGFIKMDLFKDLSWNARLITDYTIQYSPRI